MANENTENKSVYFITRKEQQGIFMAPTAWGPFNATELEDAINKFVTPGEYVIYEDGDLIPGFVVNPVSVQRMK